MAAITEEYKKLVMDDIESYVGLTQPVRASLLERLLIKKADINKLHPNPSDEFSMPEIGPNYEIVGNYVKTFKQNAHHSADIVDDPLTIEKMSVGGYMLLNGHHRWMAAHRVNLTKVPVEIVNVTPLDEILKTIASSNKDRCVSFDLDEVLITEENNKFPSKLIYKKTLKKNAGTLIRELREMGFDVWVYTGKYHSKQYIEGLFRLNHTKVDGIVNGMKNKKSSEKLRQAFRDKYLISLHVGNDSVTCVDTKTKEYELVDFESNEHNWAAEAMTNILALEHIKNIN